jgi:hypothetical protein
MPLPADRLGGQFSGYLAPIAIHIQAVVRLLRVISLQKFAAILDRPPSSLSANKRFVAIGGRFTRTRPFPSLVVL